MDRILTDGECSELITHQLGGEKKEPSRESAGQGVGEQEAREEKSLTAGEIFLRNLLYDARDELRELMQRWDNRLTLKKLNILESYHQGRLRVALHLNVAGHPEYACFSAWPTPSSAVSKPRRPPDSCLGDDQSGAEKYWQNQAVFIDNVQVVESVQLGIIPSSVWLYDILDEGNNLRRDSLYCSISNGLFTFLPRFPTREARSCGGRSTAQADKLVGNMVEGDAQVVDDVTNIQRNPFGYLIGHLKHQGGLPCLRVLLDIHTVKVSRRECREHVIEVTDVLIGPFDL